MSASVGRSVLRKEGESKLRGAACYIDDLQFPNMLFGVTVRSPVARGTLKQIHFAPHIPWHEFTVVTAKDIPGKNAVALIQDDQPYLAESRINHREEPIVLLAHRDRYLLEDARRAIHFDIDAAPAVLDIETALTGKTVIWGKDNILKKISIEKGNVESIFQQKDVRVIEGEFFTGAQEQLYIAPNGMVAKYDAESGVTVWGSLQCPYYIQKALRALFAYGNEKIRVVQTETGGGFGGKEEYPSMIAGHAALLAYKSGCYVKMIYDREEDMASTTKRHPSRSRHRTAVAPDGTLLAMDIDFVIDGGAYLTLSPVVLSRGAIHAAGPYACPHVRISARAVATNTPPHGAFRGFGAPQSLFAMERQMDRIAAQLKMSPEQIRRKNFLHQGSVTATGQTLGERVMLDALLTRALQESQYHEKKSQFEKQNAQPNVTVKRGLGMATFFHGSGFTGAGEKYLASVAGVEGTPAGKVRVLAASTEIGQGTNTVFSQIVSDALRLPYDLIEVAQPDTHVVPDSGPTVASRTCMVVGKLVETAAVSLKQTLIQSGYLKSEYSAQDFQNACASYVKKFGSLKAFSEYRQPSHIVWDDEAYKGDAYTTYAWAAYVAEVAVDVTTFETKVENFVAVQEVGKVVHPILAAGQIEGGVAQGIGYALYEDIVWKDGHMQNSQMTNYIMPTSADLPKIRVYFDEVPYFNGPQGAKGIGELPMDGPAPAILNAVEDALKTVSPNIIPMTPERLFSLVEAKL